MANPISVQILNSPSGVEIATLVIAVLVALIAAGIGIMALYAVRRMAASAKQPRRGNTDRRWELMRDRRDEWLLRLIDFSLVVDQQNAWSYRSPSDVVETLPPRIAESAVRIMNISGEAGFLSIPECEEFVRTRGLVRDMLESQSIELGQISRVADVIDSMLVEIPRGMRPSQQNHLPSSSPQEETVRSPASLKLRPSHEPAERRPQTPAWDPEPFPSKEQFRQQMQLGSAH